MIKLALLCFFTIFQGDEVPASYLPSTFSSGKCITLCNSINISGRQLVATENPNVQLVPNWQVRACVINLHKLGLAWENRSAIRVIQFRNWTCIKNWWHSNGVSIFQKVSGWSFPNVLEAHANTAIFIHFNGVDYQPWSLRILSNSIGFKASISRAPSFPKSVKNQTNTKESYGHSYYSSSSSSAAPQSGFLLCLKIVFFATSFAGSFLFLKYALIDLRRRDHGAFVFHAYVGGLCVIMGIFGCLMVYSGL
ncbi:hypothetical protein NYA22BAC_01708 [Parasphingorhabdus sp. NYA22]